MLKKLIAVALVLTLGFGLVGCGGDEPTSPVEPEDMPNVEGVDVPEAPAVPEAPEVPAQEPINLPGNTDAE